MEKVVKVVPSVSTLTTFSMGYVPSWARCHHPADQTHTMGTRYTHLNQEKRNTLQRMRLQGETLTDIAKAIGVHKSTVSREIHRNMHFNGNKRYYTPSKAQEKANGRIHKPRRPSPITEQDWAVVDHYIREDYSPEQIAHAVQLPSRQSVSHETIYKHIYANKKAGGHLHQHLRHRTRKRRKRYRSRDSRGRLQGKRLITDRPEHINQRTTIGHWEVDTVVSSKSKHCILTMVERTTGYTIIEKMINRTAEETTAAMIRAIHRTRIPVLTITADNGTEFHDFKTVEQKTSTIIYFALPHHSWERGTNENTNGLIRQYIAKRQDMRYITQEQCTRIEIRLNTRPRKRLNYQSPISYLMKAS